MLPNLGRLVIESLVVFMGVSEFVLRLWLELRLTHE